VSDTVAPPRPLIEGVEALLRELAPQVVGALVRRFRDLDQAEDAVQEALLAAAEQWPRSGLPDNPRGWLIQVAFRRMTDQQRSDRARRRREEQVTAEEPDHAQYVPAADALPDFQGDDTLILLFMCCHPALSTTSSIALTLRAVGGLTTAEIANAYMVPEATMAQRISRAKQSIKASGVPFQMPAEHERRERLRAVLHVLYLVFNEGYASSSGPELQRAELADEAIRLTRAVHAMMPDHGEVSGLLALMLLTDARRLARTNAAGDLIALPEQDRGLWDRAAIAQGVALLSQAMPRGDVGPYQLQAAVAAVHDEAERAEDTDWPQILALYRVLEQLADNPMVTLSRIIAEAMVLGPRVGLTQLDTLARDERLASSHRLDAARAHLLEKAGEIAPAIAQYERAAERTPSGPEQRYLLTQAARLRAAEDTPRNATDLVPDCERCFGLCCVALPFAASADFAIDKDAGAPCPNLQSDYRCGIHTQLRQRGFPGCTVYDCFGAGQKVSRVTFAGRDWRGAPEVSRPMFEVFPIVRQLHEMLWYLREALGLPSAQPVHEVLRRVHDQTEQLTLATPDVLSSLDVGAHRGAVGALLRQTSELVRAQCAGRKKKDRPGADLIGKKLKGADLRGANLRGAYLIAADLREADLRVADLLGVDFRDADLRGADLTDCLFLTQSQLNAAKGDATTKVPPSLRRPLHWTANAGRT